MLDFSEEIVFVFGDLMLDHYVDGVAERISPEAPVPVLRITNDYFTPGGAGNVAKNVHSLGGRMAVFGHVGKDKEGEILDDELFQLGNGCPFSVLAAAPQTIVKNRIVSGNHQMLRIDREVKYPPYPPNISFRAKKAAIVVSDYAKGTISQKLMNSLKAHDIPIIVDPKPVNKKLYKGVTLITPNLKEAMEMTGLTDPEQIGRKLQKDLESSVLITMGEKGMYLFERGYPPFEISAAAKQVYDVTGAGDTVVAVMALCLAKGIKMRPAAILANRAAGIKVGKFGTEPVSIAELNEVIRNGQERN
jgi:rfaE bifunctional protein kinase chain/domain